MDSEKVNLYGSSLRDAFRLWHKQYLGQGYYASDGDLFLVIFDPPKVIALLDVKHFDDVLTDTERVLYDFMLKVGIPVKIITGIWEAYEVYGTMKAECVSSNIIVKDYPTMKIEFQGEEQGYKRYEYDLRHKSVKEIPKDDIVVSDIEWDDAERYWYWHNKRAELIKSIAMKVPWYKNVHQIEEILVAWEKDGHIQRAIADNVLFDMLNQYAHQQADKQAVQGVGWQTHLPL